MSNFRQVNQKPNRNNSKTQFNFARGMQANIPPEAAPEGIVRYLFNFEMSSAFPRPVRIKGFDQYNSSQLSGEELVFGLWYLNDGSRGTDYIVALRHNSGNSDTSLLVDTVNADSFSSLKSDLDSSEFYQATDWYHSDNWLYMCNGTSAVKTDGSSVTSIGNAAPGSSLSASAGSSGNINGTTDIVVSYVYGDFGDSNFSPVETITVSDKEIDLTSIPTGGSFVTKRKIWRTDERSFGGQSGNKYYLAKTIDDNTTTSTTLTEAGDVLVASEPEPDDNAEPPTPAVIEKYADRMWYAGGSIQDGRILYSKELLPDITKLPSNTGQNNAIDDVGSQDGGIIKAMAGAYRQLFILTEKSTWVLQGRGFKSWQLEKVHNVGTLSPRTVKVIDGVCYFVGSDLESVYRTDGRKLQKLNKGNKNWFRGVDWRFAEKFYAVEHPGKNEYRVHLHHRDDITKIDGTTADFTG